MSDDDRHDGLNERLLERVAEAAEGYLAAGLSRESAVLRAFGDIAEEFAEQQNQIGESLYDVNREHLVARRQFEVEVRQRLAQDYTLAFDLYDTVLETIASAMRDLWWRYKRREETDLLFNLLWGNLAQAVRVAREAGHLLRGGLPVGALALQRTAYEIAVRASVLSQHGRTHPDLAQRYQDHDRIGQAVDAEEYQKHAEVLKFAPIDEQFVVQSAAARDELVERYGRPFKSQYGWAVGLPGVTAGKFAELEELAGLQHRRGFYRWSSHYIHGDAGSLRMSIMHRGGASNGVLSDLTNIHLTDPAQLHLFALNMTYLAVAFVDPPALADLYLSNGVGPLIDEAARAFWSAEQVVVERVKRLQAELAGGETP